MRLPTDLGPAEAEPRAYRGVFTRILGAVLACGLLLACAGGGGGTAGGNGGGGGGGTPSFGLSLGQGSGTTAPGQFLAIPLQINPSSGFSSAVALTALNLPSGVSATFATNPILPANGVTSTCTLSVAAGTASVTSHPLQIQAAGGGVTQTAAFVLSITAPVAGFSLNLGSTSGTVAAGGSLAMNVSLVAQNGFAGAVDLSAPDLPAGVQGTFLPAAVNLPGAGTSTLTLTAATGVMPVAGRAVTIQGSGGGVTRTATYLLSVTNPNAPGFDLAVNAESALILPGATRELLVTLTPKNSYIGSVTLGITGLPAGVTAQFTNPALPVGSGSISTLLRLTAAASAVPAANPSTASVNGQGPGAAAVTGLALRVAGASDVVAVRHGAIAAVEAKGRELRAQNLAPMAYLQAISSFMAARPEYKAAGIDVDTLCAWGTFQDGTFHGVVANRERDPNPFPRVAAPEPERAAAGGALLALPKARLFHTFGPNFEGQQPIVEMKDYLQSKNWTVRPGAEGIATVETFRSISGDGFLYVNTHGGRIELKGAGEPEDKLYAITTSTPVTPDNDLKFDDDLKKFRLGPFTAPNGESTTLNGQTVALEDTRYAITYRFVRDSSMSFSTGTVVWINACWSGRNTPFINSFLGKGASVYFGWSEKLGFAAAYAAPPYFVDRMLGANKHSDKESPAQRAFPWDLVLQDMTKKGLDVDLPNSGKLQATALSAQLPRLFAPSIRNLTVDEYQDKLTLIGEFGTKPGKVTIDGSERAATWAPDQIVCDLPQSGSGSSGDVVVEVDNVKSNARQLTEWAVRVAYTWVDANGVIGHRFDGSGTLRLRADVGGYRTKPGETPIYKVRGGGPTKDSAITVIASGAHSDGNCTQTLSGTGVYVSPAKLGGTPGTLIASAFKVDGKTKQGALALAFGAVDSPHTMTLSGRDCSGSYPIAATMGFLDGFLEFPSDQSDNPPPGLVLPGLNFTLDSSWGIPAKSKPSSDFGGTITVSWTATAAKHPPRDADDAGK